MKIINLRLHYPHCQQDKLVEVSEDFLLADLPLVPGRCAAAGRGTVRRPAAPARHEDLCRVSGAVPTRLQPGQILPRLCAHCPPPPESRQ